MNKEFYCKGKQTANYLMKNGSKLIRTETDGGSIVFVFEYDESVDKNLRKLEFDKKKYLF